MHCTVAPARPTCHQVDPAHRFASGPRGRLGFYLRCRERKAQVRASGQATDRAQPAASRAAVPASQAIENRCTRAKGTGCKACPCSPPFLRPGCPTARAILHCVAHVLGLGGLEIRRAPKERQFIACGRQPQDLEIRQEKRRFQPRRGDRCERAVIAPCCVLSPRSGLGTGGGRGRWGGPGARRPRL